MVGRSRKSGHYLYLNAHCSNSDVNPFFLFVFFVLSSFVAVVVEIKLNWKYFAALEGLGSISELQERNRRERPQRTPGRAPCGRFFVVTVHLSSKPGTPQTSPRQPERDT